MAKEKDNKEISEEDKNNYRDASLKVLKNDFLLKIATSGFYEQGIGQQFGSLLSGLYLPTIKTAPDQDTYDRVYGPLIQGDQPINFNETVKRNAAKTIQTALLGLREDDILGFYGQKSKDNSFIMDLKDEKKIKILSKLGIEAKMAEKLPDAISMWKKDMSEFIKGMYQENPAPKE